MAVTDEFLGTSQKHVGENAIETWFGPEEFVLLDCQGVLNPTLRVVEIFERFLQ